MRRSWVGKLLLLLGLIVAAVGCRDGGLLPQENFQGLGIIAGLLIAIVGVLLMVHKRRQPPPSPLARDTGY